MNDVAGVIDRTIADIDVTVTGLEALVDINLGLTGCPDGLEGLSICRYVGLLMAADSPAVLNVISKYNNASEIMMQYIRGLA
jgi:hypothetical protein